MKIVEEITKYHAEIQEIRRDIHAHPELSYQEHRTSEIIASKLKEWGIPIIRGLAGTGIVGVIKNGNSNKALGLRADMDALPMQEINQFDHSSKNDGKMHACGHDGHTAMLLGAAKYLSVHKIFDGTVYLIFQPAEEGGAGAKQMIEDGLFKQCPMDAVYGMHNWPGIPVGQFAIKKGGMMASSNEFKVIVRGKGAHAAQPQKGIDPIMAAIQIAQSWQTIISRNVNPIDSSVLSVTQIHSGSATNVIPDEAYLIGTVRTFNTENLDLIEKRMHEIATLTAQAFLAEIEFNFHRNYPPLVNHPKETDFVVEVLKNMVGEENVNAQVEPTMGAEDFAFMLESKPGCYVFIGNGEGEHRHAGHGLGPCNLHNSSYDFNDNLLPIGATYWIELVKAYLK
jgi:amidohydrolase